MDRREFLKLVGVAAGAAMVPGGGLWLTHEQAKAAIQVAAAGVDFDYACGGVTIGDIMGQDGSFTYREGDLDTVMAQRMFERAQHRLAEYLCYELKHMLSMDPDQIRLDWIEFNEGHGIEMYTLWRDGSIDVPV